LTVLTDRQPSSLEAVAIWLRSNDLILLNAAKKYDPYSTVPWLRLSSNLRSPRERGPSANATRFLFVCWAALVKANASGRRVVEADPSVRRSKGKSKPDRRLRTALVSLGTVGGLALAVFILQSAKEKPSLVCSNRVIVQAVSSSERSAKMIDVSREILQAAVLSSVTCGTSIEVYAVAGGGMNRLMIGSDDLAPFTPEGNKALAEQRMSNEDRLAIEALVNERLDLAFEMPATPSSSAALLDMVSQRSNASTRAVVITDGVHSTSDVNLNRPLAVGEGLTLAKSLNTQPVKAQSLTMVGIAQVDATTPPPSEVWTREVVAFNEQLCRASGVVDCRTFTAAPVGDVLK
jgi:hypothetical protein